MLKNTKLYKFYEQVKQEAQKVVWPNKKELITSTGVVLAAVLVFSLVCLFLDYGIHSIIQILLNIGK
jgi:preprotein translocase subunit SecE